MNAGALTLEMGFGFRQRNAVAFSFAQKPSAKFTKEESVGSRIEVKAHHPVRMVVTRKNDQTCAKQIVIKDLNISKPLPLNRPDHVYTDEVQTDPLRLRDGHACRRHFVE